MSEDKPKWTPSPAARRVAVAGAAGGGLLLFAAAGLSLLLGLGVGVGAGWWFRGTETVEVTVTREPTDEEMAAFCEPEAEEDPDELTLAQNQVMILERSAAEQERRVKELEAQARKGGAVGKQLRAEIASLKAELADTQTQLKAAEVEKKRLLTALVKTEALLETTKVERDVAREDALFNRFSDFVSKGKLEICDKGNRKKLGNCREVVEAALRQPARQARFAHCIRSGQAEPMVRERQSKKDPIPGFAEMIDDTKKQTKGWYIIYCDPTLPERADAPLAPGQMAR